MSQTKTVLITNDDSIDSPFLELAIRSLKKFCKLVVAVPATEHSWKGKSMTRHGPIKAENIRIAECEGWAISGTPADCVNLAIHNLMPKKPDLVISGINIGKNIGLGFSLASGTIGACLEGNIAGIPGIALSQELVPSDFLYWDKNRKFPKETEVFVERTIPINCEMIWQQYSNQDSKHPITWNINFPYVANSNITICRTTLSKTFYGQCFQKQAEQEYKFGLAKASIDNSLNTDVAVLEEGNISATMIDITTLGQTI